MISEIRQAIMDKLAETLPAVTRRYMDNVPQNFKPAAFLLTVIDQEYGKRLSRKYKSTISFDLAYFSGAGSADIKSDCLAKQETLMRGFDFVGTYKVLNKTAKITDNVLHLMFDIQYSEMVPNADPLMQSQETNTII
ncbi:MAG: hypothetical protein K0R34_2794 [Herbinix sp.]|jgi:hypothetical protein|nr:hypothetical protein [Herbinix sp.]